MQEFEKNQSQTQQNAPEPEIMVSRKSSAPVAKRDVPPARMPSAAAAANKSASRPRPVRAPRPAAQAPAKTPARTVSTAARPASSTAKPAAAKPVAAKPVAAKPAVNAKDAAQAFFGKVSGGAKDFYARTKESLSKKRQAAKERRAKESLAEEEGMDRGGMVLSVLKALVYIAFVLVVSGFLAVYGIRVANDIFAFVKDEITVEVYIPDGATLDDVADAFYTEGLVESADWFKLYTQFKNRDRDLTFVGGTYTLNSTMNYNTLIAAVTPRGGRTIVSVLIPEGYTVDQIIDLLVSQGIGTREGYIEAIQNYDYNYEFLDVLESIEKKDGRKYRLEGYLFPAKYDLYKDSGEVAVIDKMLAAFQANFTDVYSDRLTELGMNMDEVVTLASIIQREARFSSDMYYISGVFHNRLNNAATFPYLDSDATIQYALPEHKEELTREDLKIDSPYNTYLYPGLTPGAICNPGLEAITAALYPEDKLMESRGVKSYYFVAGYDGYSLFGANASEHENNKAKVAADKAAAKAQG